MYKHIYIYIYIHIYIYIYMYMNNSKPGSSHRKLEPVPDLDRYRGTLLIRNKFLLGPYSRAMSRAIWWP